MDEESIDEKKVTTCGLSCFVLPCEVNVCIACNYTLFADIYIIVWRFVIVVMREIVVGVVILNVVMCGLLSWFLTCGWEGEVVHCCLLIVFQVGVGGLGKVS